MKRPVTIKNKKQSNKGITLIALVITIIVLLILAGVSIATLTGSNGILTQAGEARTNTEIAEAKERARVDIATWISDKLQKGEDSSLNDAKIKEILTGKEYVKELKDTSFISSKGHEINYSDLYNNVNGGEETGKTEVDGVPIPEGFYHVAGTTKAEGLVISDVQGDDINNTKHGNQFVWVPVEEYSEFIRREGYWNSSLDSMLPDCGEADATGTNSKVTESATTQQEAKDMYKSVSINKGFYIGRYEAGKDANGNVICKKNAAVYTEIPWSESDTMNIDTGGAVEKARNFAKEKGYTSVTSTLCYGVQWDAALKFMDPTWDGYTKDSTGKGNYSSSSPINTGSNDNYKVKNIYDMAGNVWEYTMESSDTDNRVNRGGSYNSSGSDPPSSNRDDYNPTDSLSNIGFRLTLFV